MRRLMLAFLVMSPFIAFAQNYHVHSINAAPATHLAQVVVNTASMKMADVVHAVQQLLT